ncbi:MAG: hypothetical protein ABI249_03855 [Ornithinibacter sp.]
MNTHDERQDDTLATEVFDHESVTATTTPPGPPDVPYLRGPAPFAMVLGLLGLLVAGSVLIGELTDVTVRWDNLGPWTVVAAGVVVLVAGALGVRASRPRS